MPDGKQEGKGKGRREKRNQGKRRKREVYVNILPYVFVG